MAIKPVSKSYKSKYSKSLKRKMWKRKSKKRISNIYRYKRLAALVRIKHQAGDAADIFRIEDAAAPYQILNPLVASGVAWSGDGLPGTYQNQFLARHSLTQVTQATDFTNLYDRYKIVGVKATFLYQSSDAAITGGGVLPTIMYCADFDNTTPLSYPQIRAKQYVKERILTANKPFSIFYKPKNLMLVDNLGVATAAAIQNKDWLDCEASSINHLGLQFSINNMYATTAVNSQLEIKFTYYLAFKDPQ